MKSGRRPAAGVTGQRSLSSPQWTMVAVPPVLPETSLTTSAVSRDTPSVQPQRRLEDTMSRGEASRAWFP